MKYSVVLLKLRICIYSYSPNSDYMLLGVVIELAFSQT